MYVVCPSVYFGVVAERNRRIIVTLDPDYARKLTSLAERTHAPGRGLSEQARRGETVPLSEP